MDDVIVVTDQVDPETGRRFLHLMSNSEIRRQVPDGSTVEATVEKRVHHLRIEMPMRGAVDIQCEGWVKPRRLVLWSLSAGERMSENILKAAGEYMRLFGGAPMYAFTRSLPRGIEPGRGVPFMGGEILLFNAEWMPGRSFSVGGRDCDLPVAVR